MSSRTFLAAAGFFLAASLSACGGPPRREPAKIPEQPARVADVESALVGSWTSVNSGDDLSGSIVLGSDRRFTCVCRRGERIVSSSRGNWFVREGVFVWVYDHAPGFEDPNPIVEFSPDKVVIQEVSGTLTTLTRVR